MGLFDIFKHKKQVTDQVPYNQEQLLTETKDLSLTALLAKALKDPVYKSAFYKRILTEELVVISMNTNINEGYQYLEEGTSVELFSFPDDTIPLFTAIERIFDKGVVKDDVQFLKMSGGDLFSLARGATFVINPYSDYKQKILPAVVESLLDGRY